MPSRRTQSRSPDSAPSRRRNSSVRVVTGSPRVSAPRTKYIRYEFSELYRSVSGEAW